MSADDERVNPRTLYTAFRLRSTSALTVDELVQARKVFVDLPEDMWGVAILAIVKDLADIISDGKNFYQYVRFGFSMACFVANLYLQIRILRWITLYVVNASVRRLQEQYSTFHTELFDDTLRFKSDVGEDWDSRFSLCSAVIAQQPFLGAILFLWLGRMLGEFRASRRLLWNISKLQILAPDTSSSDMVYEHELPDGTIRNEIIGVHQTTKIFLYLLVGIPKFGIGTYLAYVGMNWLTSTESFADLILNALALEFVIGIDEMILECFFPESMKNDLEVTKLAIIEDKEELTGNEVIREYVKSSILLILTVAGTGAYLLRFQQVLPNYQDDIDPHCGGWFYEQFEPLCNFFQADCFPFGHISTKLS